MTGQSSPNYLFIQLGDDVTAVGVKEKGGSGWGARMLLQFRSFVWSKSAPSTSLFRTILLLVLLVHYTPSRTSTLSLVTRFAVRTRHRSTLNRRAGEMQLIA